MNNIKNFDLKQSVLSALSIFPCAVSVSEIIAAANSNGKRKLAQGETKVLLEKLTLDGETKKFPVERFRCHHYWHATTNKEQARCSRCGRVTTFAEVENLDKEEVYYFLQQQEDYIPDAAIAGELELGLPQVKKYLKALGDKVESDGEGNWRSILVVVPEVVDDELSDDEQKELLRLERKIEKAFFVAGDALRQIRDKKLYRQGGRTFKEYCFERFSYKESRSYQLIDAAIVYENLKLHNCGVNVPNFVLPSSEYQVRSLAKLEPKEQVEIWLKATEQTNGRIPTGDQIKKLVKEKKESKKTMEKGVNYQPQTEKFKVGDVVRITAKHNPELKEYHQYWALVDKVEEFSYTLKTYKGYIKGVLHNDLMAIKRASKEAAEQMIEQMQKTQSRYRSDPDCTAFLHYLATKPFPGVSMWANEILSFSSATYADDM